MSKELVKISPEGLEVANEYLECNSIIEVSKKLDIPREKVAAHLNSREVKSYIDRVYLDLGYRNRTKLASLLDEVIESKLEEAKESDMYSNKDLADLIQLAHKMRMDELRALREEQKVSIDKQTNIQINEGVPFGQGNYGKLMERLLAEEVKEC